MPTFNGETLTITLDSGVTSIDWIDVYSEWKNWSLLDNLKYPPAFRTSGGDPLNALLNSGAYWFLRNDLGWRIKPPEEDITILASGNLAPEDASIDMFLPTVGAFTTQVLGLQPITQGFSLELAAGLTFSLYNGAVVVDPINGVAGTVSGIGTAKNPSNNLTDALTIANRVGLKKIIICGAVTLTDPLDFTDFRFQGLSHVTCSLTLGTNAITDNASFRELTLNGVLDGGSDIRACVVNGVTFFNGHIHSSGLTGTIDLAGGIDATIMNCYTLDPFNPPIISMGTSGQNLAMPNYSGLLTIKDFNDANGFAGVGLNGGSIILDSTTVVAGKVHVSGSGSLTDESGNTIDSGTWNGGVTVVNGLSSTSGVVAALYNESIDGTLDLKAVLRILTSFASGKTSGGGTTTLKFRDKDDTKDRIVMTVDENGNRSTVITDGS